MSHRLTDGIKMVTYYLAHNKPEKSWLDQDGLKRVGLSQLTSANRQYVLLLRSVTV